MPWYSSLFFEENMNNVYQYSVKQRDILLEQTGGEESLTNMIVSQLLYKGAEGLHTSFLEGFVIHEGELKSRRSLLDVTAEKLLPIDEEEI